MVTSETYVAPPTEIPSLSGLRAIASLAVVFTHVTGIGAPGKQAVTINIWAFYSRRARRLLPAYYVWLTAVIVLMTGRITQEMGAAALYLSDYFNAWVKQGIISHTWFLLLIRSQGRRTAHGLRSRALGINGGSLHRFLRARLS
jgi:peptidoglycan/LPS O-acetylase OafA/YrhL